MTTPRPHARSVVTLALMIGAALGAAPGACSSDSGNDNGKDAAPADGNAADGPASTDAMSVDAPIDQLMPSKTGTFEDIQYHLYVREKVTRGMAAADEGRVVSHEEAERRVAEWLRSYGPNQP